MNILIEKNVMVPMRDGVDLAADTAFNFIRVAVRVIIAQRIEVGQRSHCSNPPFRIGLNN